MSLRRQALVGTVLLVLVTAAVAAAAPTRSLASSRRRRATRSSAGTSAPTSPRVQVFEGAPQVPAASIVSVASDRISVRSKPTGTFAHRDGNVVAESALRPFTVAPR
jgi:hypothetical protein